MSLLKKPAPQPQGPDANRPPVPKNPVAPPPLPDGARVEGVQARVKLPTKLPPDPLREAVSEGDGGVCPGLYRDNSGGVYMVVAAADGHVCYGRIDGGHAMQLRTVPLAEFLARDRSGKTVHQKILPTEGK